ncbi:hypothetical protein ACGC1H_003577 [Rhizoctonia solani]
MHVQTGPECLHRDRIPTTEHALCSAARQRITSPTGNTTDNSRRGRQRLVRTDLSSESDWHRSQKHNAGYEFSKFEPEGGKALTPESARLVRGLELWWFEVDQGTPHCFADQTTAMQQRDFRAVLDRYYFHHRPSPPQCPNPACTKNTPLITWPCSARLAPRNATS